MFTSKLLNKLNESKDFNWRAAAEKCDDPGLSLESSCLLDVAEGHITTELRGGNHLSVSYPDGTDILIVYRSNTNDFIVYPGNETSYIATVETCCGVSAFAASGEVILLLPREITDQMCEPVT